MNELKINEKNMKKKKFTINLCIILSSYKYIFFCSPSSLPLQFLFYLVILHTRLPVQCSIIGNYF